MKTIYHRKIYPLSLIFLMGFSGCVGASPVFDAGERVASTGFACPEPEYPTSVTSKELKLYVWGSSIPVEMIECFELVYGIRVIRDEYSSSEEMYARVSAGGVRYDLVQPANSIVTLMIQQGLLQGLDHSKLPVMANLDRNYLNLQFDPDNNYTLPYQAGSYAIIVNTETVASPPHSWSDLWQGDYLRRMVMPDDGRVVIGMTLLTLGRDVNTTDPIQLREARDKLLDLTPNIRIFDNDPEISLITGDVDLGIVYSSDAMYLQRENPAFQYIYPLEGAILRLDNWAILADAPHADAAYAWLNYTMQGDVFWLTIRDFQNTNPNQAALAYAKANRKEVYDTYANSPITNPPSDVFAEGFGIEDVGESTPLYDAIWVEVKGSN